MATVEKIRKDIEKTKEKISAQQKRLRTEKAVMHRTTTVRDARRRKTLLRFIFAVRRRSPAAAAPWC